MENKDQIIDNLKAIINQLEAENELLKSKIEAAYICYDDRSNANAEQLDKSQIVVNAAFDELYKEQTRQATHDELEKRFK